MQDFEDQAFVKIPKPEVGAALNMSQRTGYNRINEFGWRTEEDIHKNVWCWVPREAVLNKTYLQRYANDLQVEVPVVQKPVENQYLHLQKDVIELQRYEEMKQHYESRLQDREQLLQNNDVLLKVKDEQIQMLNRELENRNTQIQRYRSQEDLLHEMRVALDALKSIKPWWKFW